jgi:hypothetical protein
MPTTGPYNTTTNVLHHTNMAKLQPAKKTLGYILKEFIIK